jgi:hypothetical protein
LGRNDSFQAVCQFASRQQDSPPTTQAFEANIRTQADDLPGVATAWVGFPQAEHVFQV